MPETVQVLAMSQLGVFAMPLRSTSHQILQLPAHLASQQIHVTLA